MDVFDAIYVANEHNLTPDFFDRFRRRMFFGSRGFGYWCWKPQIVLQALETMDDGDILLYSDIGCHLNPARRDEMLALFTRAERSTFGILGVQISLLERMWTKGDLFDHFGVRDRPDITETGMFAGMMFWIRKSPQTVQFFLDISSVFDARFELIDDSPSKSPNLPGFIENRHDQSVYSILAKLNGIDAVRDECMTLKTEEEWAEHAFPIQVRRDKKRG